MLIKNIIITIYTNYMHKVQFNQHTKLPIILSIYVCFSIYIILIFWTFNKILFY